MISRLLATESVEPRLVFAGTVFPGAVSFWDELEGRTAAKARAGKSARSEEICMANSAMIRDVWLDAEQVKIELKEMLREMKRNLSDGSGKQRVAD